MAGTDPIYTTTEPFSDALVAAVTGIIGQTLADRTAGGILANPVIAGGFAGRDKFMRALALKAVYVAWGVDKFLAVAEGSPFAVVDLASDTTTTTPTRRGFARTASDMVRSMDSWGITQWANFAAESAIAWSQTVVSAHAALFNSFTGSGGATGAAATWATVLNDYQILGIANVAPPYVFITRPKDWANIASDALTLGGYIQNDPETAAYKRAVNPGYKGSFLGGDLDIYCSGEIAASAGDHVSGMFGQTAINWNAHMPAPSPATHPLIWTPAFGVELDRTALKSEDSIVSSTHLGASVGQGSAGVAMPFLT